MATPDQVAQFQLDNWKHALAVSKQTGIDPRIALAMAGHESDWGNAAPGNNMFGIKGPGQVLQTTEAGPDGTLVPTTASFKVFKTPEHAWSEFANNGVVQAAGSKQGYDAQLAAVAPYATDPAYTQKVGAIASGLTVPDGVQPSVLPGQEIAGGATPTTQGSWTGMLAGPGQSANPAEQGGFGDSDPMPTAGGLLGSTDASQMAAGKSLSSIGVGMMEAKPAQPKWNTPQAQVHRPQAQGEGNPDFIQALAQMRLKRPQGGM